MITRIDFASIDDEIQKAVQDTFDNIRNSNQGDYALFLSDAEYKKEYDNAMSKLNPYVIDNRIDRYKDESRLRFMSEFLSTFYAFPSSQSSTDDNEQRMHMELMVYTHIWESKPFLKKLHRLAHLNNIDQYNWKVEVPDMTKHKFIRDDIRKTFEDAGNALSDVIRNGFHTSLRNAFAHSEYSFDTMNGNKRIWLDNYNGDDTWELKEISFDEWSKRFVYSALLSYHLMNLAHSNRVTLIETIGTDKFQVKHPTKAGTFNFIWIKYRKEHDAFNFER
jgi:hypothetical protein